MFTRSVAAVTGLILVAVPTVGQTQKMQTDLCNVRSPIAAMATTDGPLKGCNVGDVVHFQVDPQNVAYSSVVARYCSLDAAIVVEKHPTAPLEPIHIVCKYEWHWAKDVDRSPHPDHRK
jgi:hypothetical protein